MHFISTRENYRLLTKWIIKYTKKYNIKCQTSVIIILLNPFFFSKLCFSIFQRGQFDHFALLLIKFIRDKISCEILSRSRNCRMNFAEESMRIRSRSSSSKRLRKSVSRKLVGSRVRNSTENSNSNCFSVGCKFISYSWMENRWAEFWWNLNKDY